MNPVMKIPGYKIVSFDPETTTMVWKLSNGNTVSKVLEGDNLVNYRGVNPHCHYLDTSNNTIVIIDTPGSRVSITSNNVMYMKATQFEYDTWMYNTVPDSDNAKVYRLLTNSE
jgi:hypothetical protein